MTGSDTGSVIVTTADGEPDGILTDRDIVVRCVAQGLMAEDTPIGAIMTDRVCTIHEDTRLEIGLEVMAEEVVRRLVVVNDAGRVVGIVSLDDFLVGIVEQTDEVGRLLCAQVHV
jgi:CBS domain-containing protein